MAEVDTIYEDAYAMVASYSSRLSRPSTVQMRSGAVSPSSQTLTVGESYHQDKIQVA